MANLISYSRIFLAFLFVYLVMQAHTWPAIFVMSLAAVTDYLDGQVARRFNNVTSFGALLDPIADRIFVLSVCLALYIKFDQGLIKLVIVSLVGREILISQGFYWLKMKGIVLEVSRFGKISTAFVFISFVVTFVLPKLGIYLLLAASGLYWISALDYTLKAWRKLETFKKS